jgi:hypothetical protein
LSEPERLTKWEREALEHEVHLLEEDSNELARKAQLLRRRLSRAAPYTGETAAQRARSAIGSDNERGEAHD